jgi:16S rRNA (guanine527-N7)-methyltransferase
MMQVGSREWRNLIAQGAESLGIRVDACQVERFSVHAEQLLAWTRKCNLTAITDPEEIAVKHFVDSLAPAAWMDPAGSLLDIGSGGGFPGIPLKILMPDLNLTLIDASRKKVSFLNHLIRVLKLSSARAVHVRAEDLASNKPAENFDAIISRALGPLDEFAQMALPLLKPNGTMIAMKGRIAPDEIESVRGIRWMNTKQAHPEPISIFIQIHPYKLPFADAFRSIICMKRQ